MEARRARPEDLAAIVALQKAAYADHETLLGARPMPMEADYTQIFGEMEIWVLESVGRIVGVLILEWRTDEMLIWSIAVHPTARKSGVGRALLDLAHRRASEERRAEIRLYTASAYTRNLDWCSRNGFRVDFVETRPERTIVHMVKAVDAASSPAK